MREHDCISGICFHKSIQYQYVHICIFAPGFKDEEPNNTLAAVSASSGKVQKSSLKKGRKKLVKL